MTVTELAAYLDVPRRELYLLAAHREATGFPVQKIGGMWLVDLRQVKHWMIQCAEAEARPLELARRLRSQSRKSSQKAATKSARARSGHKTRD